MSRVLVAVLFLAMTQPVAAAPDPYYLFSQARQYWGAQRYPHYLDYTTTVEVDDRGARRVEHYVSAYDAATGAVWVDPVSDYETEHPASGRGMGFNLGKGPQPAPDQDFLGVPELAPTYSFTIGRFVPATERTPSDAEIVAAVRAQFHDPDPRKKHTPAAAPSPAASGLPEIAVVVSYKRAYTITLVGSDNVNGHDCDHLHLEPVHSDGRYRLRDLWLDKATHATIRARTALNFVDGPGTLVPWTIDFQDVGDAHFIESETADAPVRYSSHRYQRVRIAFENIHERARPIPTRPVPFSAYLILTEP